TVLPGAGGTGFFIQRGVSTVSPLAASFANLRIGVPAAGGLMLLSDLRAPAVNLVLDLGIRGGGAGTGVGAIEAGQLLVLGARGGATLFGTVAGQGGIIAARDAL